MRIRRAVILLNLAAMAVCRPAEAEVVGVRIDERAPFAAGHAFGAAGSYEKIVGRLFLEVAPEDPANRRIVDLRHAPQNARGRVEFWSDFCLLQPRDPGRGNRCLLYDVNNSGNKLALATFNGAARSNQPSTLADAGNGFLMEQGYTILWCGWNGEVSEGDARLRIGLPVARDGDRPITGKMFVEICRDEPVFSQPLHWGPWGAAIPYAPAHADHRTASLTMRPNREQPPSAIPHDRWDFGRWENGRMVPDPGHLYVKDGIRPGWLYELTYEARDPRVLGLGFAAVRDSVSFFRYGVSESSVQGPTHAKKTGSKTTGDVRGENERRSPAAIHSPSANRIDRACIFGISQSGRFINHFLFEGFNSDECRRTVFEGALIHVAGGGRGQFNHRFGIETVAGAQHENMLSGTESFPFTTVRETDPVSGESGDLLARCKNSGFVPKILIVQSATEYWNRGGSLCHTDVAGARDVQLDPNVRLYSVAGAQHLGGTAAERGIGQNLNNPLDDRPPVLRALLTALHCWIRDGRVPPCSRYPRIDDGTLVDLDRFREMFPRIPGVALPARFYRPRRLDFGPRWRSEGIADQVPPGVGPEYRTLVPAVDADGNEVAGIRLPDIAAPLATYTGWNLRSVSCGAEGMLAPYHGSYLPFARTPGERQRTGDPRPSVLERYPTREAYLTRVRQNVAELKQQGFLLDVDAAALIEKAASRDFWEKKPDELPGARERS